MKKKEEEKEIFFKKKREYEPFLWDNVLQRIFRLLFPLRPQWSKDRIYTLMQL